MHGFGDLEAVIMHRVWDHGGPVTVRELFEELQAEASHRLHDGDDHHGQPAP